MVLSFYYREYQFYSFKHLDFKKCSSINLSKKYRKKVAGKIESITSFDF